MGDKYDSKINDQADVSSIDAQAIDSLANVVAETDQEPDGQAGQVEQ